MPRRVIVTILTAGVLSILACGRREQSADPPVPKGPPLWQVASVSPDGRSSQAHLRARSPCRVEVVLEGFPTEGDRRVAGAYDLPAGRTVAVSWKTAASDRPERGGMTPPSEAQEKGRTDAWQVALTCEFDRRALHGERAVVWARPDHGRRLLALSQVPGRAEEVPFGAERELACAAIVDAIAAEEAELRPGGERSRVHFAGEDPEGSVRVFRLLLRVEARTKRGRSE